MCRLPGALSTTSMPAVKLPAPVGLKARSTWQLAPGATFAVHRLSRIANCDAPVPVSVTDCTSSGRVPPALEMPTVHSLLVLPDMQRREGDDLGLKLIAAVVPAAPPVPTSGTANGSFSPVCRTTRSADRSPVAVGAKLNVTAQLAPGARVVPTQAVVVAVKSPASGAADARRGDGERRDAGVLQSIVWVGEVVPIGTTPRSPLAGSASSGPCSLPTTLNTLVLPTWLPPTSLIWK